MANNTRTIFAGGYAGSGPSKLDVIDYIIEFVVTATTGNTSDFGRLDYSCKIKCC